MRLGAFDKEVTGSCVPTGADSYEKDRQMRKKEATAIVIALTLGVAAGCAPGDISRYAQRAQQMGEEIFEGGAVKAAAGPAIEAPETETTDRDVMETEPAAETENISEKAGGEEKETETAAEPVSDTAVIDSTPVSDEKAEEEPLALPAMMTEVPEKALEAMKKQADRFTGHLAGRDRLSRTENAAILTVLKREAYDEKTLCLQNAAVYDGKDSGSFLLFMEGNLLTARERVRGDLWYFDGETAEKIADDTVFNGMRLVNRSGRKFLLTETKTEEGKAAQVYLIKEGKWVPCFEGADEITETADGFCVSYPAEYVRYDPLVGEWNGGENSVPYFYTLTAEGFVQQTGKELTVEEYLSYIQPGPKDAAAREFLERQEEIFYSSGEEEITYSYRFFSVGTDRIGYEEHKIGLPAKRTDGIDYAVAEYSYGIFELQKGKLAPDSVSYTGKGRYFTDYGNREEELAKQNEVPAALAENEIGSSLSVLSAAKKKALNAVTGIQEYPEDALCFVDAADYDGDGKKEAFVAVGSYDGAFGAAVCDLWFVGNGTPQLLAEGLPMKRMIRCGIGKNSLLLFEGYEVSGTQDLVFAVTDQKAHRCLPEAGKIEMQADGSAVVRQAGRFDSAPGYYYFENGSAAEYALQQVQPKMLLDYENGGAVYKRLLSLAGGREEGLECLLRDNGLFHVMITGTDGAVSYETYRLTENFLILTDCGKGGYTVAEGQTREAGEPREAEEETDGAGEETQETVTEETTEGESRE